MGHFPNVWFLGLVKKVWIPTSELKELELSSWTRSILNQGHTYPGDHLAASGQCGLPQISLLPLPTRWPEMNTFPSLPWLSHLETGQDDFMGLFQGLNITHVKCFAQCMAYSCHSINVSYYYCLLSYYLRSLKIISNILQFMCTCAFSWEEVHLFHFHFPYRGRTTHLARLTFSFNWWVKSCPEV